MTLDPDDRLNFFFEQAAHICDITYVTKIS